MTHPYLRRRVRIATVTFAILLFGGFAACSSSSDSNDSSAGAAGKAAAGASGSHAGTASSAGGSASGGTSSAGSAGHTAGGGGLGTAGAAVLPRGGDAGNGGRARSGRGQRGRKRRKQRRGRSGGCGWRAELRSGVPRHHRLEQLPGRAGVLVLRPAASLFGLAQAVHRPVDATAHLLLSRKLPGRVHLSYSARVACSSSSPHRMP